MARPRRRGEFHRSLSLGGRVPPVVGAIILLILAVTVGSWLLGNKSWAALSLPHVLGGQVWRLLTWPLVQDEPLAIVFGGLAWYFFGPQLALDYGERRFALRMAVLTLCAGALSLLVAFLVGLGGSFAYRGIWPLVDGLILLWALRYPDQQILFFFVLPVSGRLLALLTVATNVLYALWGIAQGGLFGVVPYVPGFAALLVAWAMSGARAQLPLERLKLSLRDWWMEQKLRRRSRHLKVVRKGGQDGDRPRWLN